MGGQLFYERSESVGCKLGTVKCGGRKAAERLRERFGRDHARVGKGAVAELFGEERGASDGCSASAAKEPDFGDAVVFDARGETENIAADGISDFDGSGGVRKFAGIAGIAEVIENGVGEHREDCRRERSRQSTVKS